MKKLAGLITMMVFIAQANSQVMTRNEISGKTASMSFRTVYETNQYYNDLEESIELKYSEIKVPVFEKMEGPQDSLWLLDEQINTFRDLIKAEELSVINWEAKADRNDPSFAKLRMEKQENAKNEITKLRNRIDQLELQKPGFITTLKEQEIQLERIDQQKEKELEKARSERKAALVHMYKA